MSVLLVVMNGMCMLIDKLSYYGTCGSTPDTSGRSDEGSQLKNWKGFVVHNNMQLN